MSIRSSGYPLAVVNVAREMHAAGWKPTAIRRALERQGAPVPSRTTIIEWVTPGYRERQRTGHEQRQRQLRADSAAFRLAGDTPEYRLAFMRRLADEGVSATGISKVYGVVFGEPLAAHRVRYALVEKAAA